MEFQRDYEQLYLITLCFHQECQLFITHDLKTPIDRVTTAEIGEIQIIVNLASESHVDRSIENLESLLKKYATCADYVGFLSSI